MKNLLHSILTKKQDGERLTKQEIKFFVDGVCDHSFSDSEIIAMLKAIFENGLTFNETYYLTLFMSESGATLHLKDSIGDYVDKHSTGGVSDSTSLLVVPMLASLNVRVVKMSGRSLGFTGGTADKMEVFSGFHTELSADDTAKLILKTNAAMVTQSEDFVPADKILYTLRNQSGYIQSIPLIASSIMSKKLACGASAILLDVKFGTGAFMKEEQEAIKLAKLMVEIGKKAGRNMLAVVSDMNEPLTEYIGNRFEVISAMEALKGKPSKLSDLAQQIVAKILKLINKVSSEEEGLTLAKQSIENGSALNKLKEIVASQGGSLDFFEHYAELPYAKKLVQVLAEKDGYISAIDCETLGEAANDLCKKLGKFTRQDESGMILNVKLGDKIEKNQVLATLFYNDCDNIDMIQNSVRLAYEIAKLKTSTIENIKNRKLIVRTIS